MRLNEKLRLANSGKGGGIQWPSSGNPEDTVGIEGWFQTDSGITSDVNGVSAWTNKASGDLSFPTLEQTDNAEKPSLSTSYFPSGKDAIVFDGVEDHLTEANVDLGTANSFFYVFNQGDGWANDNRYISSRTIYFVSLDNSGGTNQRKITFQCTAGNNHTSTNSVLPDPADNVIVEVYRTLTDVTCYVNGTEVAMTANNTTTPAGTFVVRDLGATSAGVDGPTGLSLGLWGFAQEDLRHLHSDFYSWLSTWSGIT